ncbi:hypothetical protein HY218_00335 [Candidatus Saccharibacteria bacterium]|nr:hypothetical protein [Candidatus Saccharibacteria bacterium]
MAHHQNVIELKGKRYDAITGHVIAAVHQLESHPKQSSTAKQRTTDGFLHPHHLKIGAQTVHTKPARSQTLMRSAVKKPFITATVVPIDQGIEDFSARKALEDVRWRRAKKIATNKLVSRFGKTDATEFKVVTKTTRLGVKPAPPPVTAVSASAFRPHGLSKAHQHIQKSLARATAHTEKPPKKPKLHHRVAKKLHLSPRRLNASLAVLTLLLLGGFIAYQNGSAIAIRMAAAKAGIAVTVPAYTPAGFSLQTHVAKAGQITLGYASRSDSRTFQVTQTVSAWDNNTLLENFVAANAYQTTSSKGRKIYLYNGDNATWVDNGIWYKVESHANLSSDQLQHLIDSI